MHVSGFPKKQIQTFRSNLHNLMRHRVPFDSEFRLIRNDFPPTLQKVLISQQTSEAHVIKQANPFFSHSRKRDGN